MSMESYRIRASSIAAFFDCPARWAAQNLDGMRMPSTPPAVIGSAVHASTAAYDGSRLEGKPITADDAAEVLMQHLADPGEEVDWQGVSLGDAAKVALGVHSRYCSEIAPIKNYLLVEATMDTLPVVFDDIGVTLELTGTLDRLYSGPAGTLGVADIKTGARVIGSNAGKHKAQVGVYELLAQEKTGKLIEAPGELIQLQTSSNYGVNVEPMLNCTLSLLGDDNRTGLLTHLARALKSGDFWGNSSTWLCSEKFCPAWRDCIYR